MYDDSAGAMYEQEEYAHKEALRRKKLLIRRIVVVSTILVVSLYTIFFLVDQSRFKKGQKPLITFKEVTKTYNDGTVTSRYGLGWVFREYNRESLLDTEMVPFWKRIRQDYDAATTVDSNLPQVVTGYEVPDNPDELEKVDGVIFLYDGGHLLDTYKCILSDTDCEIATSYLYSDEVSGMYDVKMSIVDKRYAFIREYQDKGTENETSYVLLYDIKNKQILAKYEDIHYSKRENGKGIIDSSKYIIKKNGLWGIDQVINGRVSNVLDYRYYGINFYFNSKKYVLKSDEGYQIYDINANSFSNFITDKIEDIVGSGTNTFYTTKTVNNDGVFYTLYNANTLESVLEGTASYIELHNGFIAYVRDNKLYLSDFSGNNLLDREIPLYFNNYNGSGVKAFTVEILGNQLRIATPKTNETTHYTTEYYFDSVTYSFIRTRENVKETVE
mgnify:FL=1